MRKRPFLLSTNEVNWQKWSENDHFKEKVANTDSQDDASLEQWAWFGMLMQSELLQSNSSVSVILSAE